MKKLIFCLSFIIQFCFGVEIQDVWDWEQLGQYNRICQENVRNLFITEQNEAVADIYAKACLKVDKVNELIIPIVMLYKTKDARENASIYSTILFQKKMLYLALIDNIDISYIRTPKINYVLSEIFDKFVEKKYKKTETGYVFEFNNGEKAELSVKTENQISKMVVALYKDGKVNSIKMYW